MKISTIVLSSIASLAASVNAAAVDAPPPLPTFDGATCKLNSKDWLQYYDDGWEELGSVGHYIGYFYTSNNHAIKVTLTGGYNGTDFFIGDNALKDCSCIPNVKPDYHLLEGATTDLWVTVDERELLGFRMNSHAVDFKIELHSETSTWMPVMKMEACSK
ncbi:hypothetical protein CAAN3_08S01992 [[Candida] anglica]